ncbi:PP2C family protein-serine/threonine phosphatase [Streptomyces coelicoflavus]|uniref:PP2C family protein-serine/threonine phosphatase n=1 Tax=Streptomyces coelicoflavus TaxID=285562 RepID=UPI002E274E18
MQRALLRAGHLATFEQMPLLVARHAEPAGLHRARIFVTDLQGEVLREVTGRGSDAGRGGQQLRIMTTVAGTAYTETRPITVRAVEQGRLRHWLPLLDGAERLGVLRVDTDHGDDTVLEAALDLASLVALLLVSKRTNSDAYARLIRTTRMTVSAEMQWPVMPPRTFSNDRVTLAAVMEPAYAAAGDAFDYGVAGDVTYLAILDAMGHDTGAGLTANLAMAAFRNQRRQDAGLPETCAAIEELLITHYAHTRYATAILAELDMATGVLTWVNCGHHPPVLVRGGRWTSDLPCSPSHPLGTDLGLPANVCDVQLEPGDRVLLYTDGITEARDADGQEFGRERFVDYVIRHQSDGLPVPETLRRLIHAVLDYHDGKLDDDATVLLCQWHGNIDQLPDPTYPPV